MHFDIFTLFPAMFAGPLDDSIVMRAREAGIVTLALHNIRDYAEGKHAITDDYPYGGGGGMVMKPAADPPGPPLRPERGAGASRPRPHRHDLRPL